MKKVSALFCAEVLTGELLACCSSGMSEAPAGARSKEIYFLVSIIFHSIFSHYRISGKTTKGPDQFH